MAGLKELRLRLESAKSTQQLTSAMKMVSVSKLRKAQTRLAQVRETCFRYMEIFNHVARSGAEPPDFSGNPLMEPARKGVSKVLVIAIASEKGLCGSFNLNVCRAAEEHIRQHYGHLPAEDVHVLGIGAKAVRHFKPLAYPVRDCPEIPVPSNAAYEETSALMEKILAAYGRGEFHQADVVYCRPVNAAMQVTHAMTVLPVKDLLSSADTVIEERLHYAGSVAAAANAETAKEAASFYVQSDFLPSREAILETMLPSIAVLFLHYALCQSAMAEHGARMTAMGTATDNADELIKNLNLAYNKLRQSSITNELIEIVSGANALD